MPTRTSPYPPPDPSTSLPPASALTRLCIIIQFGIQYCPSPAVSGFWLTRGNVFRKRYARVATRSSNLDLIVLATSMDMLGFTQVDMHVCIYESIYRCIYFISIVGSITCSAGLPLTPLHAIGFPGATSAFQVARTCRSALQSLVHIFYGGCGRRCTSSVSLW